MNATQTTKYEYKKHDNGKMQATPENIARVKAQYGEKIEFVYNETVS